MHIDLLVRDEVCDLRRNHFRDVDLLLDGGVFDRFLVHDVVQVRCWLHLGYNRNLITVIRVDFGNFPAYFVNIFHMHVLCLEYIVKLVYNFSFFENSLIFISILFGYKCCYWIKIPFKFLFLLEMSSNCCYILLPF